MEHHARLVQGLVVGGPGITCAEALVASGVLAHEGTFIGVNTLVRHQELALVEALLAALVRAAKLRVLARVILTHVLGQILQPRELLIAAWVLAHELGAGQAGACQVQLLPGAGLLPL